MAWNPFKAIGDAIGRALGRGESAPPPAPEPRQEAPAQEIAPQERRGLLGRIRDIFQPEREREQPQQEQAAPSQPEAPPERELPKFGGETDYAARDERAFGTDSQIERDLQEAIDDFIADRGGLDGLSVEAQDWLEYPSVSQPFSDYWQSGGFTADQVLQGIQGISNIRISEGDDGDIQIEFDYDAEVDGYEVHGHAG